MAPSLRVHAQMEIHGRLEHHVVDTTSVHGIHCRGVDAEDTVVEEGGPKRAAARRRPRAIVFAL